MICFCWRLQVHHWTLSFSFCYINKSCCLPQSADCNIRFSASYSATTSECTHRELMDKELSSQIYSLF